MAETKIRLVFCTLPNREVARQIGTAVIDKQLAACVNLIPSVESIYRWEGQVERGEEVLAIFKTSDARYAELQERLAELHPYEVPEIIGVDVAEGLPEYLRWVARGSSSG